MRSEPGDGIVGEQVGWVRKLQEEWAWAQPGFGCADGKLGKPSGLAHGNVGIVDCPLPWSIPGRSTEVRQQGCGLHVSRATTHNVLCVE